MTFLGGLSDVELQEQYAGCRALLFPGQEDFGIVPVEAQAFGRPVIAFDKGGALETVIGLYDDELVHPEQATGIFLKEQSGMALVQAILWFEKMEQRFSPSFIRAHAERFDKQHFLDKMSQFIAAALKDHRRQAEWSGDDVASLSATVGY